MLSKSKKIAVQCDGEGIFVPNEKVALRFIQSIHTNTDMVGVKTLKALNGAIKAKCDGSIDAVVISDLKVSISSIIQAFEGEIRVIIFKVKTSYLNASFFAIWATCKMDMKTFLEVLADVCSGHGLIVFSDGEDYVCIKKG